MFNFLYGILIFIFILSCNEDDSFFNSNNSSSSSYTLKNGDTSRLSNPNEFTGSFKIWSNDSGEIVFYTESEKSINVITCQNCSNIDNLALNGNGTLTFLDHSFVFNDGENSYYFAVNKPEEKEIKSLFDLNFLKQNEHYGTGITYHWFDKELIKDTHSFLSGISKASKAVDFIISSNNSDIAGKISCSSGGEGSSSCSMGGNGCSVSCASGFWACCNSSGCNCIESTLGLKPLE